MPFKNCYQCHGDAKARTVVKKFASRECGHVICTRCHITHDADVDDISTSNMSAADIANISDEAEYRKLFVETSTIKNDKNEVYGNFKWDDQKELRSGVASHVVKSLKAQFSDRDRVDVLDVGCGNGFTSIEIVDELPAVKVCSIDPSPQVLGVNGYQDRVQAIQTTLQGADFGDRKFDAVVIVGNLMLHDNPLDTIDHALAVLKKDGLLIIDYKNINSSIRQLSIALARTGVSRFLPTRLFNRNFLNMRFGFHDRYLMGFMKSRNAVFHGRTSKPPRLLEFGNKSEFTAGWKGVVWKMLDRLDVIRKQQAWVQLEFIKK